MRSLFHWDQTDQRNLSRLPRSEVVRGLSCSQVVRGLPCSESVRGLPCSESVRGLSCSESVRDEMRLALWSVESTTWGAYFTGTQQTKETISAVNEK